MTITADDVTTTIRAFNQEAYPASGDLPGFDSQGWNVPTFNDQSSVDRFLGMTVRVTLEHETRNGVYWEAAVTLDGQTFDAENRGDGGCNWYNGDREAIANAQRFAAHVFPDQYEALDTLLTAREAFAAGLALTA